MFRKRQIYFILPLVMFALVYLLIIQRDLFLWNHFSSSETTIRSNVQRDSYLWNHFPSSETIVRPNVKAVNKSYLILIWHWPFDERQDISGNYCKNKVGVSNCMIVDDQSQFPKADVVIFHNWELANSHSVPLPVNLKRPEKQKWIWFSHESPLYNGNVKPLDGYFNWTMSYRRDADIYVPYGYLLPREHISTEPVENFIPKNKTHLACWIVSKNKPHFRRVAVYNELKTVIPIEVYGRWTGKRMEESEKIPTISRCFFYLAFENSVYKDYITEKFWYNSLAGGAVPVVLGASQKDYEAVAPKGSFIHVDDFSSVKELGEFLKKLAEDKERYASYFNWRLKYNAILGYWLNQFCEFCPKISSLPPKKIYKDLDAWQNV